MGSIDRKSYSLPRDKTESNRLDLQHKVYVANAGFLLHPRIASTLPEKALIAEVGTGTGVWLRHVASESPPSWTYTGFDISAAQFPQQEGIIGPCHYAILNILEDIPEKYKGQFHLVHLRLLICGLTSKDWATAACNAFHLLKPGGWIQWHEADHRRMQVLQNVPDASTSACRQMIDLAIEQSVKEGKFLDDVLQLSKTVESVGFEGCSDYIFSSDRIPETREAATEVEHGAVCALAKWAAQESPEWGWTSEKVDEMAERAKEELEDGKAYKRWEMHIVTGRKPIS